MLLFALAKAMLTLHRIGELFKAAALASTSASRSLMPGCKEGHCECDIKDQTDNSYS